MLAIGLDMGTGGARAVAVDLDGRIVAEGRVELPPEATRVDGPRTEQDPQAWSVASQSALRQLTDSLPRTCQIVGVAVDATSGTFLLADHDGAPLTPGLMYNDLRAAEESPEAADALRPDLAPYGIQIAAAFALPKIVHLARHEPGLFRRCRRIVHQTDWIVGTLCGRYDVTDISTALKTGADPGRLVWPAAIDQRLDVSCELLPGIVLPGTQIGEVTADAAHATGLPTGTPVVAGCTDGTAGCLASGASRFGDLNVTLGTTLVFKAVTVQPLIDPIGAVYNHRHPGGGYLPGAASSTGCDWISKSFPGADLDALGQSASDLLPAGRIAYPLAKTGERFPFACETASGFGLDEIEDGALRFATGMDGVALLERMGIERLESLGLEVGPTIYATGGGASSETWLKIRASVSRRTYSVPARPECALGAAVLAAMPHMGSCEAAIQAIVRPGHCVEPDEQLAAAYDCAYEQFQEALRRRGYL